MSSSRYSSKVHQREGRTALFSSTQQQALSANQSPTRFYSNNNSSTSLSSIGQRNGFSDPNPYVGGTSSPYETDTPRKRDYNASMMSQLESQNDETVNILGSKIEALKNLSVRMGDEINKSGLNLNSLGGDMELTKNRIKNNFNRMTIMASKTGISWKIWLLFFGVILWIFFWVWLF